MNWVYPQELFNPVTSGSTITLNRVATTAAGTFYRRASGAGTGQASFGAVIAGDLASGATNTYVLTINAGGAMTWVAPATPLITSVDTTNGLYVASGILKLSATSNETFGSAVITSGTITTLLSTNLTTTNHTNSGVTNAGTLIFGGTTGSLTTAGAFLIPGAATIAGNFTVTGGGTLTTGGALTVSNATHVNQTNSGVTGLATLVFSGTTGSFRARVVSAANWLSLFRAVLLCLWRNCSTPMLRASLIL